MERYLLVLDRRHYKHVSFPYINSHMQSNPNENTNKLFYGVKLIPKFIWNTNMQK